MVRPPKILIIDDSTSECLLMAQALQQAGYQALTALNGREGLSRVQDQRPQAVILDIILPDLNGYEICRNIRSNALFKDLPILMISTKNTPLDKAWGLRQGANRYLPKPFSKEMLISTLWDLLPERSRPSIVAPQSVLHPLDNAPELKPLQKLIPQRVKNSDLMWSSNINSLVINDKQARRLYMAIDGRKTVERLPEAAGMDMDQVLLSLRYLVAQHRIELCEPGGKLVDTTLYFKN